jgi:lipid-binding SYLF domain-containing protein
VSNTGIVTFQYFLYVNRKIKGSIRNLLGRYLSFTTPSREKFMKYFKFNIVVALTILVLATSVLADDYSKTRKMFGDAGISKMFTSSYGYALFPLIGKAGFVIGGAYGKGRVFEKGAYIGDTSMTQATIGFQLGGTGFSQVVFFKDKRALDHFTNGNFEFGAEVQGTVLTAAAKASANTSGSSATASGGMNNAAMGGNGYYKGMATFAITKGGLMYEASIGGQKFSFSRR